MATYPFFPFYPADWISSPRIMCSTLAEQGAYIRLLSVCWLSGTCSIPDDDKKIATLSGLPEQELTFVRSMFTKHPTIEHALTNERLLLEWVKAQRISDSRSQAGKKSGKSRRTHVHHLIEQNKNKNRTIVGISQSQSHITSHKSDSQPHSQVKKDKKKKEKTCEQPTALASGLPSSRVWERYKEAYLRRYKAEPLRNLKTNSQISQLIKRVGGDIAPDLAEFYVWHNDAYYVRSRHPPGLLLRDCEGLHTQWITGQTVTQSQARKIDETQGRLNVFQKVINERQQQQEVLDVEVTAIPRSDV
ncbi:MAG: YdaU family protein [Nitrospira sp.]|nr:YdaU family protein [Nitrospira sp.]MDH5251879.1 YdaU family protein [Nitrospira sp.]